MFDSLARAKRKAFTLVELLVVIGIIAVLISILLPSLARARQQALTVSCAANLRQIGQGLLLYANDQKGRLPYSVVHNPSAAGVPGMGPTEINNWWIEVSTVFGIDCWSGQDANGDGVADGIPPFTTTWNLPRLSPALRCPDAQVPTGSTASPFAYTPNANAHYNANFRMMPDSWEPDNSGAVPRPMQLSSVKDSASKAWVWDGQQTTGLWSHENANCYGNGVDGWVWSNTWGNGMIDTGTGFASDGLDLERQVAIGANGVDRSSDANQNALNKRYNRDGSSMFDAVIRFRHNANTVCNILFADGHVEGAMIGGIPRRMWYVNK